MTGAEGRARGRVCEVCGRERAPTLSECPWCRPQVAAGPETADDGPAPPDPAHISSFPSRVLVAALFGCWAATLSVGLGTDLLDRPDSGYVVVAGGALLSSMALVLGLGAGAAAGLGLGRLTSTIRIGGERAHPAVAFLCGMGSVGPLVVALAFRLLTALDLSGLGPEETATCTGSVAHQHRDRDGALVALGLEGTCALADGSTVDVRVPESAARNLDGASFELLLRRGGLGTLRRDTRPTPSALPFP